ncbi:hypothetical protein HDU96_009795 [Phlyctochytrium bullatum]|nr:hypothetical protein HDU96_009795 [Phlyctochytrium bullatum]
MPPTATTNNDEEAAGQASFSLPTIQDHPSGWGPSSVPFQLTQIPYAPFSKSDRLGKIADWTLPPELLGANPAVAAAGAGAPGFGDRAAGAAAEGDRPRPRRGFRGMGAEAFGTGTASAFAFSFSAEEEASFSVVDRASTAKRPGGGGFRLSRGGRLGGGGFGRFGAQGAGGGAGADRGRGGRSFGRGGMMGRRRYGGYNDKPQRIRDASVQVGPEWKVHEEIDFPRLNKLYYEVDEPEDIATHGSLCYYDKTYDRVSTKLEKPLLQSERVNPNLTTSNDPVLLECSKDISGPAVFATDNILSTLMCAARSLYSWDIVIQKTGDKLFFDKRDASTNFDFFTVNENAADPPMEGGEKDGINTPGALAQESTNVLRNYQQQIVKEGEKYSFAAPNPFEDPDVELVPSVAYRYRKWNLGDDISLVVRTTIDAAMHAPGAQNPQAADEDSALAPSGSTAYPANETLFIVCRSLNEFDSRAPGAGGAPDWRQKLDGQRGAVMATEIKNNGNKLARWTTEALLAGADQFRIGFVSRVNPKDRNRHAILGTAFFKPKEFAGQMNLSIENGWGIVKTFVDLLLKMPDGKYVMVKDPNKAMLRLYSVPPNTFEDEYEGEL